MQLGALGTGPLVTRVVSATRLVPTWMYAGNSSKRGRWTTGLTTGSAPSMTGGESKLYCILASLETLLTGDQRPVFALSRDLGTVKGGWAETVFTIGVAQRDSIQWVGEAAEPQSVPSLWASYFQENDLVPFFYHDYDNATHAANRLDLRIQRDSVAAAGQDYATITTLSLRQTFGALAYTGTPDNPLIFLEEISSNSDIQTVDVIFPAFPILLYLNPNLLKYLLEPLLLNDRYHYPNDFAQHDLGRFPRALGYADGNDEHMPLEECGNMIIMMLAYSQLKHDDEYLSANWDLLVKWAQYMINDAKIPASQLSTDDFAGHLA